MRSHVPAARPVLPIASPGGERRAVRFWRQSPRCGLQPWENVIKSHFSIDYAGSLALLPPRPPTENLNDILTTVRPSALILGRHVFQGDLTAEEDLLISRRRRKIDYPHISV